jgi:hypothetical protein
VEPSFEFLRPEIGCNRYALLTVNLSLLLTYTLLYYGTGLIVNNENSIPQKFWKFDEIDKSRGTIFGVPVTIFLAVSPDPSVIGRLVDLLDASYKMGTPLYVSSLSIDGDKMDDAFTNPYSLYLTSHYILLAMVLMGSLDNGRVMVQYYSIRDGKIPVNYCTFSLVITAVANVFRIARAIDVLGVRAISSQSVAYLL